MTRLCVLPAFLSGLLIAAAVLLPAQAQPAPATPGGAPAPGCTFSAWLSSSEFQSLFNQKNKEHYLPAMVEGRSADGQRSFRGCFQANDIYFFSYFGVSPQKFAARDNALRAKGYALSYKQSFDDSAGTAVQATWVPAAALATPQGTTPRSALVGRWRGQWQWPSDAPPTDLVFTITSVTDTAMSAILWANSGRSAGPSGGDFIAKASPDGSYSVRFPNGNGWDRFRPCGSLMCADGYNGADARHMPMIFSRAQ